MNSYESEQNPKFDSKRYEIFKTEPAEDFHRIVLETDDGDSAAILSRYDKDGRLLCSSIDEMPFIWQYYYSGDGKDIRFVWGQDQETCRRFLTEYSRIKIPGTEQNAMLASTHRYYEGKEESSAFDVRLMIPEYDEQELTYGYSHENYLYIPKPIFIGNLPIKGKLNYGSAYFDLSQQLGFDTEIDLSNIEISNEPLILDELPFPY